MVGIVVVAHSHKLAQGVRELALQMAPDVHIAAAGGQDDETIGTSMERIQNALEEAWNDEGVLVLMDLGSAVMYTEMAVEVLPPERRVKVRLSEAPVAEGAIAAAVEAAGGASLEQVAQAALEARRMTKVGEGAPEVPPPEEPAEIAGEEIRLQVRNRVGLHARPAARFAQTAGRFDADVLVRNLTTGSDPVNAKSLMGVVGLGAEQGHHIAVSADGVDADQVLEALRELVEEMLVELEPPQEAVEAPARSAQEVPGGAPPEVGARAEELPRVLEGVGAAAGLAIGPTYHFAYTALEVERWQVEDPAAEWERFQDATAWVREQLQRLQGRTAERAGAEEAAIFEAQAMILSDPEYVRKIRSAIEDNGINAEAAVVEVTDGFADQLAGMDQAVFQARAADVRDVGRRVVAALRGEEVERPALPDEPVVLIARDLTPAETVGLDPDQVLGFCTAGGGSTSHTAILARAFGLPAVVGIGDAILRVSDGTPVIVDGMAGRVLIDPDGEARQRYAEKQADLRAEMEEAREAAGQLARTRDGKRVEVVANAGDVGLAQGVLRYGAEGIGLLRTEFLYLGRNSLPSEAEQYEAYRAVADAMGDRPLIIRTLDVGGDKQVPYLDTGEEMNPFLGWRAVRISLDRPDVFKTQLRAILRAGHGRNVKVMFPLVSGVDEVRQAKALLGEVQQSLQDGHVDHARDVEVGVMIEVPSAAVLADRLAREVDFFSIGTNDLTQYVLAADRGNERVAGCYDPFHPAVLRLLQSVIKEAHGAGIWVGLCGEMAGQPQAIPLLLGLGLDEFSMEPASIPEAKRIIAGLTLERAAEIADQALSYDTTGGVRRYLEGAA